MATRKTKNTKKKKARTKAKTSRTAKARARAEQKRTLERTLKKQAFLQGLVDFGTVRSACEEAGIVRSTAYEWREEDKEFEAAWELAVEDFDDALEEEAVRRGRDGYLKPVFQGGKLVGKVREYSDGLLRMVMQARMKRYGPRAQIDLNHTGGIAVVPATADPADWNKLLEEHGAMQKQQ